MSSALLPPAAPKLLLPAALRAAAKQSEGCHVVSISLRRAIKKFLRDNGREHMRRKVLLLSASFERLKGEAAELALAESRRLMDDPSSLPGPRAAAQLKADVGRPGLMRYGQDETVAYVASRMPAVYSACYRVLREIRRRIPEFAPAKVLDFGAGPCSALWAMREVWPKSIQQVNLVEPSKDMQRAGQALLGGFKGLPLIHSYDNLLDLSRDLKRQDRQHDLVISSYALGEVASLNERITIVRQLWSLTRDVLVLLEPGTPQGSKIIGQMRSYLLWMAKRNARKKEKQLKSASGNETRVAIYKDHIEQDAFVVAPCPHDGRCPLENTNKYCHFVQRLERTSSQRVYKRSKDTPLRGFEDEKFCYVALRRGKRPQEPWPLDGMKFETLKERLAKRKPEDLIIDFEDQFPSEDELDDAEAASEDALVPYASDSAETSLYHGSEEEEEDEPIRANLGSGWGRIIYMPFRRGRHVQMDVCHATKRDGSEGAFKRIVLTQRENPDLHLQARRSLWGDLWPC